MPLKLTSRLKSSFEHDEMLRQEVSDSDIHLSRLSGMAPRDVDVFCDFTREEGLLVIIRCPKRAARYFHGKAPPKPLSVKDKSDPATGLATTRAGRVFVSDYDLMSVWRFVGRGEYEKIFFSAPDARLPAILTREAQQLLEKVNWRLQSPIQHGAQDDYHSPHNPNVQMETEGGRLADRFMVFNLGLPAYVHNGTELRKIYERLLGKDSWPYDDKGRYTAARS